MHQLRAPTQLPPPGPHWAALRRVRDRGELQLGAPGPQGPSPDAAQGQHCSGDPGHHCRA
eukprot:jgi/Chlat1/6361/Chrsp44S05828